MSVGIQAAAIGVVTAALAATTLTACKQSDDAPAAGEPVSARDEPRSTEGVSEPTSPEFVCPADLSDQSVRQGRPPASPPPSDEPAFPAPDRAWVCVYQLDFSDPDESPHDTWLPAGPAVEAADDGLTRLTRLLAALRLEPIDNPGGPCPANLGPTWLLVVEHGARRSGLTYADFGCGDLQLTDDATNVSYEVAASLRDVGGLAENLSYVYENDAASS